MDSTKNKSFLRCLEKCVNISYHIIFLPMSEVQKEEIEDLIKKRKNS
jgi:hypothetical protein